MNLTTCSCPKQTENQCYFFPQCNADSRYMLGPEVSGAHFFLSPLPLIFRTHFSLLLTKNIDIFMAKKLPILILIFLSIKISIF